MTIKGYKAMNADMKLILIMLFCLSCCLGCGKQGSRGQQGAVGPQGNIGTEGPTGANGSTIMSVQLCGSCQAVYPSDFPETAFCIDGNLYGVYSTNGGFLALLPPGQYSSDGVGCSCVFSILENCQISN